MVESTRKVLGEFMLEARRRRHLSREELAYRANVHQNTVANWENGDGLTLDGFVQWCDALGMLASEVLRKVGR
tara:strand:+ start:8768 stop:8986 length:219 start_codon:yes stop_codon:yes gene_type:complete